MQIPLIDLKAQFSSIAGEVSAAIQAVCERCDFILGQDVTAFEQEFAAFCGAKHAVGVANGTDAIHLACRALGIGRGDEVITVANTFVATPIGATMAGATPVFVDCREEDFLIDPAQIEAAITPRTKAIIPVHLYGQCVDMEPILALAKKHGLYVIEDAAQAHGASYRGQSAGSMGDIACFSFYPGKNLGAAGDGGACVTNSDDHIGQLRYLRNWGSTRKYYHDVLGFNSRLDTMQAAVLRIKLRRLAAWNEARSGHAADYSRLLQDVPGVITPLAHSDRGHVFHLYVVRVPRRDDVLSELQAAGVGASIHYPVPCHLSGAFQHLGHKAGSFPVSERLAGEILTLPMYAELNEEQKHAVVGALKTILCQFAG